VTGNDGGVKLIRFAEAFCEHPVKAVAARVAVGRWDFKVGQPQLDHTRLARREV
jgi:hypothetical protein